MTNNDFLSILFASEIVVTSSGRSDKVMLVVNYPWIIEKVLSRSKGNSLQDGIDVLLSLDREQREESNDG